MPEMPQFLHIARGFSEERVSGRDDERISGGPDLAFPTAHFAYSQMFLRLQACCFVRRQLPPRMMATAGSIGVRW